MEQKFEKKDDLIKIITKIKNEKTNCNLLFGRSDNYKLYKTLFKKDEIQFLKNGVIETIEKYINESVLVDYDIDIANDDSIEVLDIRGCKRI